MVVYAGSLNRDRKNVMSTTMVYNEEASSDFVDDPYSDYNGSDDDSSHPIVHHVNALKTSSSSSSSSKSSRYPSSKTPSSTSSSSSSRHQKHKQRDRKRSSSRDRSLPGTSSLKCWHCGVRGHAVNSCPVHEQGLPQTSDGQKAYSTHCAETGEVRVYDAAAIYKRKNRWRGRSDSRGEKSGDSESEITVISDIENDDSSRQGSPHPTKTRKHGFSMKVVCSMKHLHAHSRTNISTSPTSRASTLLSTTEKQVLFECVDKENAL